MNKSGYIQSDQKSISRKNTFVYSFNNQKHHCLSYVYIICLHNAFRNKFILWTNSANAMARCTCRLLDAWSDWRPPLLMSEICFNSLSFLFLNIQPIKHRLYYVQLEGELLDIWRMRMRIFEGNQQDAGFRVGDSGTCKAQQPFFWSSAWTLWALLHFKFNLF